MGPRDLLLPSAGSSQPATAAFHARGQPEGLGEAIWFTAALQRPLPPTISDNHLSPKAPNCHLHVGLVVRTSFRLLAILSVQLLEFLF